MEFAKKEKDGTRKELKGFGEFQVIDSTDQVHSSLIGAPTSHHLHIQIAVYPIVISYC